ncbi:TcpE family conjugal transfer membrane protein [Enterococcus sp. C76]|uniref:TcpE family conjugal transfer membrane protein n=1 Tax=Enterococcus TaxID=1350 RepID=UPI0034A07E15
MYYDYEIGLRTPYSVQVFRSPKGKIIWYFAQPVSLRFIGCLLITAILFSVILFRCPLFSILGPIRYTVWGFATYRFSRWYEETEIAGRRGFVYLKDCVHCMRIVGIKGTVFFRGRTVEENDEFCFKR